MTTPRDATFRRDLFIVAGAALVVRILAFVMNVTRNPAFDYLIMDAMHIDAWAKSLAAGESSGVYFRGPLVPWLFAFVHKLGGGVAAIVALNHAAGVVTAVCTWLVARAYFERRVALVAGLFTALFWPLIYFEGEVLIEPIFVALVMAALWCLARAVKSPSLLRALGAGVLVGLAALARPTILVLLPVIPLVFLSARALPGRRALVLSGAAVAAAILMLVPATLHNFRVSGAFVPVTWSGGLNFWLGNNERSDGRSSFAPGAEASWTGGETEALELASRMNGSSLGPADASKFFADRAWEWIGTEPAGATVLALSKLHMFWEGPERSNEKYIYFFWDRFGPGLIPMPGTWLIAPLALVALLRLWPRRRELSLLYLFVLAYMLGVVAFFVVARYRVPAAPVLCIFAGWAAVELWTRARARDWKALIATGSLFVVCFVFANISYPPFLQKRTHHDAMAHYTLAAAHGQRNDEDATIRELEAARRAYERAPSRRYERLAQDVYLKLGTLWYARGRCEQAVEALGQVKPGDPRAQDIRRMFAECCEKLGRIAEAGRAYQIMAQADPTDRGALEGLIRCLQATGKYEEAAHAQSLLDGLPREGGSN